MLARGTGWLQGRTPKAVLALLCAGAFAPFLPVAVPVAAGTAAAAALAVAGALGAEMLADVIKKGLERLSGDRDEARTAEVIAAEIERALDADGPDAASLRAEIARIFQVVDVSSVALDAAGDGESRDDIGARLAMAEALAKLGQEFAEFRSVLDAVQVTVTRIEGLLQRVQEENREFQEENRQFLREIRELLWRLGPRELLWRLGPAEPPVYVETVQGIHSRTRELLDREQELGQIRAFATGSTEAFGKPVAEVGYLWLRSRPWAGKTALLAEAFFVLPPEVDVVAYFLTARDADASRDLFLAAVVPQLAWLLKEGRQREDLRTFRWLWREAAERAKANGRYLLLVIDGLDEDQFPESSVAAALPTSGIGQHARVLVASRLHPGVPDDVDVDHPLRYAPVVELPNSLHADRIKDRAEQEIRGLLRSGDRDEDLRYGVLGLLTAATAALTVDDLARMSEAPRRAVRNFVTERAARIFEEVPAADELGYRFAHDALLERCDNDPEVGGNPSYRATLHAWADEWRAAGWPPHTAPRHGTPRYLLDKYPELLAGATGGPVVRPAEPERLAAMAGDVAWIDSAVSSLGVEQVMVNLRKAAGILSERLAVTSTFQLLQLQAHHLQPGGTAIRPGFTATQLGLEALRAGLDDIAASVANHLERCRPPQLIPQWTTSRTGHHLVGVIGRHDGAVGALAVTLGGRVLSGGADGTVRIWNPAQPEEPAAVIGRHDGAVGALAVTLGGRVLSGGADGTVRIWNPAQPEEPGMVIGRHKQRPHLAIDYAYFGDGVAAVAVLPDRTVVSAGSDDTIKLWDLSTPGDAGTVLGRHVGGAGTVRQVLDDYRLVSGDGVNCLAVLPDGRVASAGGDGAIRLWKLPGPGAEWKLRVLGQHGNAAVLTLTVLPNGQLVSGGSDGMMLAWDPDGPDSFDGGEGAVLGEHDAPVLALAALSAAGGRVVSAAGTMVRLWEPARRGPGTGLASYFADVVRMLQDGRVLSQGEDNRVRLWDPARPGIPAIELGPLNGRIFAAAWAPSGQLVTSTYHGNRAAVRLWDPSRPAAPVAELEDPHDLWVSALAVLQDGRIAFGGLPDGSVWLWDPSQPGEEVAWLGAHDATVSEEIFGIQLGVLPNRRVVSSGDDGFIRLWDPDRPGDLIAELSWGDGPVSALAVLPNEDGQVVCGCRSGAVRVWDPDRPEDPGKVLGRHDREVLTVAALPDRRVVSGGGDGVVRLWDPDRSDEPGIELARHDGEVFTIAVLADGRQIAINSRGITLFKLLPS
jgi:WD40 repeat protein